jgi:hypothetical protein
MKSFNKKLPMPAEYRENEPLYPSMPAEYPHGDPIKNPKAYPGLFPKEVPEEGELNLFGSELDELKNFLNNMKSKWRRGQ